MTKEDDFHGVISRNIYTFVEADPYIMYLLYKKNATAVSLPVPFGFPGGRGRREKCTDRTVSACRKLPERAPERKTGRNRKENRKNLSKSVDKSAGVWYYT